MRKSVRACRFRRSDKGRTRAGSGLAIRARAGRGAQQRRQYLRVGEHQGNPERILRETPLPISSARTSTLAPIEQMVRSG